MVGDYPLKSINNDNSGVPYTDLVRNENTDNQSYIDVKRVSSRGVPGEYYDDEYENTEESVEPSVLPLAIVQDFVPRRETCSENSGMNDEYQGEEYEEGNGGGNGEEGTEEFAIGANNEEGYDESVYTEESYEENNYIGEEAYAEENYTGGTYNEEDYIGGTSNEENYNEEGSERGNSAREEGPVNSIEYDIEEPDFVTDSIEFLKEEVDDKEIDGGWMPEGIILGPGGMKAHMELGALIRASSEGYLDRVHTYVGVSAGAIISLLYISGYDFSDIFLFGEETNIFKDIRSIDVKKIPEMVKKQGIIDYKKVKEELTKKVENKFGFVPTLSRLFQLTGYSFVAVTYNVTKEEPEFLDRFTEPDLSSVDAGIMSLLIPGLFHKLEYRGCVYIDGAFGNPYPVNYLDDGQTDILGIYIYVKPENTESTGKKDDPIKYAYDIANSSMNQIKSQIENNSSSRVKHVNLYCPTIDLTGLSYSSSTTSDLVILGYNQMKKALDEMRHPEKKPIILTGDTEVPIVSGSSPDHKFRKFMQGRVNQLTSPTNVQKSKVPPQGMDFWKASSFGTSLGVGGSKVGEMNERPEGRRQGLGGLPDKLIRPEREDEDVHKAKKVVESLLDNIQDEGFWNKIPTSKKNKIKDMLLNLVDDISDSDEDENGEVELRRRADSQRTDSQRTDSQRTDSQRTDSQINRMSRGNPSVYQPERNNASIDSDYKNTKLDLPDIQSMFFSNIQNPRNSKVLDADGNESFLYVPMSSNIKTKISNLSSGL